MRAKFLFLAAAAFGLPFATTVSGQVIAVTNARIVTVSGAPIEKGTVVIRDGLIQSVGANVSAPADARIIDAAGATVYPGFIDTATNYGVPAPQPRQQSGQGAATQQAPQTNSNYPAGLRPETLVIDDLRAGDAQFESPRNAGFTTAVTVGRTGIFQGQSTVINLAGDNVSSIVVKTPFAQHVAFNTVGQGQYPGSLMGTFSSMRQMFLDAQRLRDLRKMYDADPKGIRRPDSDRSLEALIPLLNREVPVVFNANREIEIVRALDLAKEFNLRAVIAGGQEAWKVADRLKTQNVPVLLSLNFPKRTAAASADADPEDLELLRFRAEVPKTASRLQQAGVKFAFQTGGATNYTDAFENAGKAVSSGLPRDLAVKAFTLDAAELLGIADRTGSIDSGKIANLMVVKGDVFAKDRTVTHVIVDGQLFEIKAPPRTPARPAAGPAPALPAVAGNYSITIDVPGQTLTGTLALVQQGATITGSLQTQLGTSPVNDGKVSTEGFTFTSTVEFGGSTIDIIVKGSVTGNAISGTIDSPQGTVPFSGTRNP